MKVSVMGMGAVGAEIAGRLAQMPEVGQIMCVNRTRATAEGEVLDILHTSSFNDTRSPTIHVGDQADITGSDIVIVTAGPRISHDMSRDELLGVTRRMVLDLIPDIERFVPDAIILVVTNPVDVIAQIMFEHGRFDRRRLISLGTLIDTARFMSIVSDKVGLDPKNVFGYVLGDHSETAFIPWSVCKVCGMDVDTYCRLNDVPLINRANVHEAVVQAGLGILRLKGYTSQGIGASACRVVRAIANNEKSVLPLGVLLEDEYGIDGLVMSMPCVIGSSGIERVVRLALSTNELSDMNRSAAHLRHSLACACAN